MIKLFHGKNSFLSYQELQKELSQIQEKYSKDNKTYDTNIVDASTFDANGIINEIETPGFLVSNKIIVLKRISDNDEKENLREYIIEMTERNNLEGVDILVWEPQKIASNTRLVKAFLKIGSIWESPDLNKRTFLSWAKEKLAENEIKIDHSTTHLLSERVNYDTERFTQEISKIKLLGKDQIVEEDIERLCPDTLEHTIWELIDSINEGERANAEKHLENIIRQGNDPFFILTMLARNIRMILLTKVLLDQDKSVGEIAKKLKSPPFIINKIKSIAREISSHKIKRIYEKLSNIDYSGKTGQLDVELALNILLSVI